MRKIIGVVEGNKINFVKGFLKNYSNSKETIFVFNYSKEKGDDEIRELCHYNEFGVKDYGYNVTEEQTMSGLNLPLGLAMLALKEYCKIEKIILILDYDVKYKDNLIELLNKLETDFLIVMNK